MERRVSRLNTLTYGGEVTTTRAYPSASPVARASRRRASVATGSGGSDFSSAVSLRFAALVDLSVCASSAIAWAVSIAVPLTGFALSPRALPSVPAMILSRSCGASDASAAQLANAIAAGLMSSPTDGCPRRADSKSVVPLPTKGSRIRAPWGASARRMCSTVPGENCPRHGNALTRSRSSKLRSTPTSSAASGQVASTESASTAAW